MNTGMNTVCPDFLVVDEHVARNPVARAVARARITQAVRDFTTRVYMLQDGEPVAADGVAVARVLAVAIRVCEQRGQADSIDSRVMRGALECVVSLAKRRWVWRIIDASAIDAGLTRALAVYRGASAHEQQQAHRYVIGLEREAERARGAGNEQTNDDAALGSFAVGRAVQGLDHRR